MLVARWFVRISIPGNSVRCARCFQSGVSPLKKNGSPQMLKLGNASARTTAMRAEASSSCARRAVLMPASLPPIMRIDKGIGLWFRLSGLPRFEARRRFERLAGLFHCVAWSRVSAGKVFPWRRSKSHAADRKHDGPQDTSTHAQQHPKMTGTVRIVPASWSEFSFLRSGNYAPLSEAA